MNQVKPKQVSYQGICLKQNGDAIGHPWKPNIKRRTIVKAFVEFGHETSYTKSSSNAEFKT